MAPDRPPRTALRGRLPVVLGAAALVVAIGVLAMAEPRGPLSAWDAVVLGVVEGVTEYLPISSTGHLLVAQRLLGLGSGSGKVAADTYAVAIQSGAILAVVALYRPRIRQLVAGLFGADDQGRRLLVRLVVAFLPAAVLGLVLGDVIKEQLFGPWPVVVAWAAGGVFLLWWRPRHGTQSLEAVTIRGAVIVGVAQSLALWPGVSRSLVTIVAALAIGCHMAAALELSFLLGLATLTAATVLDLTTDGPRLLDDYGWQMPLLGALVALVTAVVAVRWLVAFLRTRPLATFGWYRLAVAAATGVALVTGAL